MGEFAIHSHHSVQTVYNSHLDTLAFRRISSRDDCRISQNFGLRLDLMEPMRKENVPRVKLGSGILYHFLWFSLPSDQIFHAWRQNIHKRITEQTPWNEKEDASNSWPCKLSVSQQTWDVSRCSKSAGLFLVASHLSAPKTPPHNSPSESQPRKNLTHLLTTLSQKTQHLLTLNPQTPGWSPLQHTPNSQENRALRTPDPGCCPTKPRRIFIHTSNSLQHKF